MPTELVAQNGATINERTPIKVGRVHEVEAQGEEAQ
jgi:hypothetical protein